MDFGYRFGRVGQAREFFSKGFCQDGARRINQSDRGRHHGRITLWADRFALAGSI